MEVAIEQSLVTEYVLCNLQLIKQGDKLYLKIYRKDLSTIISNTSTFPIMHLTLFSPPTVQITVKFFK